MTINKPLMREWGHRYVSTSDGLWTDIQVDVQNVRLGATAPTFGQFDGLIYKYRFSPAQVDGVLPSIQFPHGVRPTGIISPHVHFSAEGALSEGETIIWKMDYIIVNIGTAPGSVVSDTATYTCPAGGVAARVPLVLGLTDIDAASFGLSSIVDMSLRRWSDGAGADTYADWVWLNGFDFHAQIDRFGTRNEYND